MGKQSTQQHTKLTNQTILQSEGSRIVRQFDIVFQEIQEGMPHKI